MSTTPVQDVAIALAALPLWWALGIEQFVPPLVAVWATAKTLASRRRVRWTPVLSAFVIFLAAAAVSALFIEEPFRYLTFARNGGMYLTAAGVTFVVLQARDAGAATSLLFKAIVLAMAAAAVIGALGFLGIWQPRFTAPVAALLPGEVRATDLGSAVAVRRTGGEAWFRGLGDYFRVSSLFLYATMYAASIAIAFPVLVFVARRARRSSRLVLYSLGGLLLANLVFATGRAAAVGLVLGWLVWLVVTSEARIRMKRAAALGVIAITGLIAVPLSPWAGVLEQSVLARGSGSVDDRTTIYLRTLEEWGERPLFGWGTERDITDREGFRYPAGSHSTLLGMLYRHGVVGFAAFLLVAVLLAARLRDPAARARPPPRDVAWRHDVLRTGVWSFVTASVISFTSVLDLDATLMLVTWIVFACALRSSVDLRATEVAGVARDG